MILNKVVFFIFLTCSASIKIPEPQEGFKKQFVGTKLMANSTQTVFYCEKTIAVAEFDDGDGHLVNCELVTASTPEDRATIFATKEFSKFPPGVETSFENFVSLMLECERLPALEQPKRSEKMMFAGIMAYGIVPGTKWCGPSDKAANYFNLGFFSETDKCCRTHDFCPITAEAGETVGGITNTARVKTSLHCVCDEMFYQCLKNRNSRGANIIGREYFNALNGPCIKQNGLELQMQQLELPY